MTAFHQHVGADGHPPVRGVEDGGVVAGADGHTFRMHPTADQTLDDGEFTDVAQGGLGVVGHGWLTSPCGTLSTISVGRKTR